MSDSLLIQHGYKILDFNVKYEESFFVTIENLKNNVPFTVTLDIGDVEDFCIDIPNYKNYKNLKHYMECMTPEQHIAFVHDILNKYVMCFNTPHSLEYKQHIMAKIYDLIKHQVGILTGESFTSVGNKIADVKIDVFARKIDGTANDYVIWMESPGISEWHQWLKLYTELLRIFVMKPSLN